MTAPLLTKPKIRILLYTDDPRITESNSLLHFFGLGSMIERMRAHAPVFADLEPTLVSRNPDRNSHAKFRINEVLEEAQAKGEPFDEIWFFGLHQANLERFSLGTFLGGPKSELFEDEVEALSDWMKIKADGSGGGGVLITGDHSEQVLATMGPASFERCSGNPASTESLGLGRAIGRCVPRAGQMRRWEGPPSSRADRFSTIADSGFEADGIPQRLFLELVNASGDPDPNGQPHPLFMYKAGQFIRVFPDHVHEGAVVLPTEEQFEDFDVWPRGQSGEQTRPRVVAVGTNSMTHGPLNIIATYNGDLCERGRIVADSTWHHYFNLNLAALPHPAAVETDSDKIGQFYANLAIWLAPRRKRIEMAQAMALHLSDYTWVLERYQEASSVGRTAEAILAKVASLCEIHEMHQALGLGQPPEVQPATLEAAGLSPSRSMILGSVIKSYHEAMVRAETNGEDLNRRHLRDAINHGYRAAVAVHVGELNQTLEVLNTRTQTELRKETQMECPADRVWNIATQVLNQPKVEILIFCLDINEEGHITGKVEHSDGTLLSDVSGRREPLGGIVSSMTLNFDWDSVSIVMVGLAIGNVQAMFIGGFHATGNGNESVIRAFAPGDGDTGTATGNQT